MKQIVLAGLFRSHGVKLAYLFGSQKEKGLAFLNDQPVE